MLEKGVPVIHKERPGVSSFSAWGAESTLISGGVCSHSWIKWCGSVSHTSEGPVHPKPCGRSIPLHHMGDIQSMTANPLVLRASILKAAPYLVGHKYHLRICFIRSLHRSRVLKIWPLLLQKNLNFGNPGVYRGTDLLLNQEKAAIRVEFWKKQLK